VKVVISKGQKLSNLHTIGKIINKIGEKSEISHVSIDTAFAPAIVGSHDH